MFKDDSRLAHRSTRQVYKFSIGLSIRRMDTTTRNSVNEKSQ